MLKTNLDRQEAISMFLKCFRRNHPVTIRTHYMNINDLEKYEFDERDWSIRIYHSNDYRNILGALCRQWFNIYFNHPTEIKASQNKNHNGLFDLKVFLTFKRYEGNENLYFYFRDLKESDMINNEIVQLKMF